MKLHWKIILGLLTAVVPSFFTYLAARADSDEAKVRAEMAYVAMQANVKELQEASYKQAIELAEIRGQLKVARKERVELSKATPGPKPLFQMESMPSPVRDDADDIGEVQVKLEPPPEFHKALEAYKAKN